MRKRAGVAALCLRGPTAQSGGGSASPGPAALSTPLLTRIPWPGPAAGQCPRVSPCACAARAQARVTIAARQRLRRRPGFEVVRALRSGPASNGASTAEHDAVGVRIAATLTAAHPSSAVAQPVLRGRRAD